ncbi:glycine betaine/proline transport system permease protein [Natranaerovirga hydrolytica]|uniref:Glycine betaine/proline transport system permease protein n=1 Tax=Natranaerovirga hydrolytica TaxID=680378 RepID=A0A4R1N4X8_9FIRM|nr:proline/glycine betaine ABC transporter permease [Natranaerovirga hydrolytica]TCK98009.1 glycine betaine/proline transport system permease protein [Natranaerovirga hydrolytica]
MFRLPIGDVFETFIDILKNNLGWLFDAIDFVLDNSISGLEWVFGIIPAIILIVLFGLLAWYISGKGLAIFTVVGLLIIDSMNLWGNAIDTLALVLVATLITLLIGIPLGIWASRSNTIDKIIRPILDFMQTMPAFVYLIPVVIFFGIGKVPGAIATITFSMPPVVRLTNLGIRQVPVNVVEAARSFGSTPKQMLFKVQLPIALPTILAGVNQTILLSLSMVVISAMIGARGLGSPVLLGIEGMQTGRGFEGGLAVVILAMILDRMTQALGNKRADKNK